MACIYHMEKNNNTETHQITVANEVYEQLRSIDRILRSYGYYKGSEYDLNRVIKYALIQAELWDGELPRTQPTIIACPKKEEKVTVSNTPHITILERAANKVKLTFLSLFLILKLK